MTPHTSTPTRTARADTHDAPQVVSLVFFPWFFDNKYVARVRQVYKDYFL